MGNGVRKGRFPSLDIKRRDEKLWDLLGYVAGFDTEVSPGKYLFHDLIQKISGLPQQYQKKFRLLGTKSILLAPFIDQKRWEHVIKILDMVDENTTYGELYDIVKSGCH